MKKAMIHLFNGEILTMDLADNEISLTEIVEEMREKHDDVLKIDVQINMEKLKNDVSNETYRFLIQS